MPDSPNTTWPALLAHWTAMAQASRAIPDHSGGERFRAAVPAIIALQAVTCALDHLHLIPEPDRPAAIDKAAHLVAQHAPSLAGIFADAPNPLIDELIRDARAAINAARARSSAAP